LIRIEFENLRLDRERIESWSDAILGVVADFQITVDDSIIYREVEFPVIELAYKMHRWLLCEVADSQDLEYESMESEQRPLIWFRRTADHWVIGAAHQLRTSGAVQLRDVESAARHFITALDEAVRTRFSMSLLTLLLDSSGRA
jgi:hypothetical protein